VSEPPLVVDLSADVAGAFAAKLLAMAGDRVVRPAPPVPDGPDARLDEGSPVWLDVYLHAHKEIRAAPEVELLVGEADVVFTSFDGGRWTGAWDEARVRAVNPRAVHVTTSSFGTTGPRAGWRGASLVDWAAGGYLFLTGEPDREPLAGPEHLCGFVAGWTAAIAAEAGRDHRRRTGGGVHYDVSTAEAVLGVHQSTFSRLAAGIDRVRSGRYTEVYPLTVRPCRDGWVSLGVMSDEEWDRFTILLGRPELAVDERFADRGARLAHSDELDAEVDPFLTARDAAELVDLLQAHRIPCAAVARPLALLEDPQLAARGFWDAVTVAGRPGRMPGNPLARGAPPPERLPRSTAKATANTFRPGGFAARPIVLDLSVFWAGPSATRNLADLGWRVVRIERPGSRVDAPDDATDAMTLVQEVFFNTKMNRGKESVVLDLKRPEGREALRQLAMRADVLLENHRPGVMGALGLGYAELAADHPGLVYVSLSGFGQTGPRAWWGSYGPTIEAASSIEGRTGYPGGEPLRLGHTLPDGVGGLAGTLAALLGVRQRERTGVGGWWDVSQLETYAVLSGHAVLAASVLRRDPERLGPASPGGGFQGVFRCAPRTDGAPDPADEWVAVVAATADERAALAALVGEGDGAIERWTAVRPKEAAADALQAAGIPAAPVSTPRDLVADPQLAARGFFVVGPIGGRTVALPGSPLHATPTLVDVTGRPPRFGEHTAAVLAELLAPDT
jgi:crotonobetainyl-CoA:carnitine CoA-transferase CaiB-like acyl-CoA transferase